MSNSNANNADENFPEKMSMYIYFMPNGEPEGDFIHVNGFLALGDTKRLQFSDGTPFAVEEMHAREAAAAAAQEENG